MENKDFADLQESTKKNFVGKRYISIRRSEFVTPYEENLYERLLPLKNLTKSAGLVIYWTDISNSIIIWKQTTPNDKERVSIPIDQKYAGIVVHSKRKCLIEDLQKYDNMEKRQGKRGIFHFPILNSRNYVLAVIELFRNDGYAFSTTDRQYVSEVLKWVGLSLQQSKSGLKQKNEHELNEILSAILFEYFSGQIVYQQFLGKVLNYAKRIINAEKLFFFNIQIENGEFFNAEMFVEIFDQKTKKNTFELMKQKIKFHKTTTFGSQTVRTMKVINPKLNTNDARIDLEIMIYVTKPIESILYFPIIFNEILIGMAVFINNLEGDETSGKMFTDAQVKFLEKVFLYSGPGLHFKKTTQKLNKELARYEVIKDCFGFQLLRSMTISDEVTTNPVVSQLFYEFTWYPQENDDVASLTYFMFNDACKNLFNEKTLQEFILAAKKGHRDYSFHNFYAAFLYVHRMYCILRKIEEYIKLDPIEKAALLTSCLFRNFNYNDMSEELLQKINHPLTYLYDHHYQEHHCQVLTGFVIEKSKLMSHLPKNDKEEFLKIVSETLIISFPNFGKYGVREKLTHLLDEQSLDLTNVQHRKYVLDLLYWCAIRSRHSQKHEVAKKLCENLYLERFTSAKFRDPLGVKEVHKQFERSNLRNMNMYEIKFIEEIILPHYLVLVRIFPILEEFIDTIQKLLNIFKMQVELEGKTVWSPDVSIGRQFAENYQSQDEVEKSF